MSKEMRRTVFRVQPLQRLITKFLKFNDFCGGTKLDGEFKYCYTYLHIRLYEYECTVYTHTHTHLYYA